MNKKRIILASTLAVLVAPTVLGNISNNATTPVQAATTTTANTIKNPIGTVDYGGAYTVDANGKQTSLFLSGKSSWKLGKSVLINGQRYYEVATNNYISSEHITLTDGMPVVNPTMVKPAVDNQIGTLGYAVKLVDAQGNPTGRTLPAGSSWKLGGMYNIGMNTYYQVGNNEYALETGIKTSIPATSNNQNSNNQTTQSKTVGTTVAAAKVVDINGRDTGVTLPSGSSWQLGQLVNINGSYYFQVATNEYVYANILKTNYSPEVTYQNTVITLSKDQVIYNDNNMATGYTLPAGSSWKTDKNKVILSQNARFYHIGTNQWVKNDNEGARSVVATLNSAQKVYDSSTNSMTRTLPSNSSWHIGTVVINSKNIRWGQVSKNEWIKLGDSSVSMSYGDSEYIVNTSVKEPNFALNF